MIRTWSCMHVTIRPEANGAGPFCYRRATFFGRRQPSPYRTQHTAVCSCNCHHYCDTHVCLSLTHPYFSSSLNRALCIFSDRKKKRSTNSGLTREGRAGLFKFIFSMLEGKTPRPLPRQELETFVRRLRPDLTEVTMVLKTTRKLRVCVP